MEGIMLVGTVYYLTPDGDAKTICAFRYAEPELMQLVSKFSKKLIDAGCIVTGTIISTTDQICYEEYLKMLEESPKIQ